MTLIKTKARKGHVLVLRNRFSLKWINGTEINSDIFRNNEQMRAAGVLQE